MFEQVRWELPSACVWSGTPLSTVFDKTWAQGPRGGGGRVASRKFLAQRSGNLLYATCLAELESEAKTGHGDDPADQSQARPCSNRADP